MCNVYAEAKDCVFLTFCLVPAKVVDDSSRSTSCMVVVQRNAHLFSSLRATYFKSNILSLLLFL